VKITKNLMFSKKIRKILPQILWTGGSIAFWSGLLIPLMIK
jgi:hypothetical protein